MRYLLVLAVLMCSLLGCSGSKQDVVGKWTANMSKSDVTGGKKLSDEEKMMAETFLGSMTLDLKEDKTGTLHMFVDVPSTWALEGDKLTVTPNKQEGQTIDFGGKGYMEFTLAPDGKSMTFTSPDPKKPGTVVLEKASS